jgi:hypothetical protein
MHRRHAEMLSGAAQAISLTDRRQMAMAGLWDT